MIFQHVLLLAETLLERLCGYLRKNWSYRDDSGSLQYAGSVDHDGGFFMLGPAIAKF